MSFSISSESRKEQQVFPKRECLCNTDFGCCVWSRNWVVYMFVTWIPWLKESVLCAVWKDRFRI